MPSLIIRAAPDHARQTIIPTNQKYFPFIAPQPKIFCFFHLPAPKTHFFPIFYFLPYSFALVLQTFFMKPARLEVMRNPTQIRLYDIFRRDLHLPDDRAQNLVSTINDALNEHREEDREELATKAFVREEVQSVKNGIQTIKIEIHDLEVRMTRQIYLVNLIQFLAIVGAILAIFNFLRK
jgi:hypothetical protein